jgi:hypothetical protein
MHCVNSIAENTKIFAEDRREEARHYKLNHQVTSKSNGWPHCLNRFNSNVTKKNFNHSAWSSASLRKFDY